LEQQIRTRWSIGNVRRHWRADRIGGYKVKLDRKSEPLMWRKSNGKTDWDKMQEVSRGQQRFEAITAVIALWFLVIIFFGIFG